jgi:hypothetical protein
MSKMGKRVFWNILISDFKLFWSVLILFFTFGCAYSGFDDDSIKYKKEGLLKEEVSTAVELMLDSIFMIPGVRGIIVVSIHEYDSVTNSFYFSVSYVCSKWDYYPLNIEEYYLRQNSTSILFNFEKGFDENLKLAIFRELNASRISRKRLDRIGYVFETLENDFSNYQPPTLYVVVKDGNRIFAKYVVEPPTLKGEEK